MLCIAVLILTPVRNEKVTTVSFPAIPVPSWSLSKGSNYIGFNVPLGVIEGDQLELVASSDVYRPGRDWREDYCLFVTRSVKR